MQRLSLQLRDSNSSGVTSVCVQDTDSPSRGRRIVSSHMDRHLRVWNIDQQSSNKLVGTCPSEATPAQALICLPSQAPKGNSVIAAYSDSFKRVLVDSKYPSEAQQLLGVTEDVVMKPHGTVLDIRATENSAGAEMVYLAETTSNAKSVILSEFNCALLNSLTGS